MARKRKRKNAEMVGPLADIGRAIKLLRTRASWTQARLSDEARMTKAQISNYERGRETPSLQSLDRILVALGVTSPRKLAAALEEAERAAVWTRRAEREIEGDVETGSEQREEALETLRRGFDVYLRTIEELVRQGRE